MTPNGSSPGWPSIINPAAVLGVHDLSLRTGKLKLLFGLSGPLSFRDALGPGAIALAQVARVKKSGELDLIGDLATHENVVNPAPLFEDSDPFGLLGTPNGAIVADAGRQ